MQPNVAKTIKTCFATNSFTCSSKANRTQRAQRAKRLQQHKLLKAFKLHFEEFLDTLSYQIQHKTIKKVIRLLCPKRQKLQFSLAMRYISGALVIWFRGIHYLNSLKTLWGRLPQPFFEFAELVGNISLKLVLRDSFF